MSKTYKDMKLAKVTRSSNGERKLKMQPYDKEKKSIYSRQDKY